MSLELTQQVKQEQKLGFDRIQGEKTTILPATVQTTAHGQGNRSDRNFVNVTTPDTTQTSTKTAKKSGGPASKAITVERVNLGFQLSFSIPLSGIMPTPPNSQPC